MIIDCQTSTVRAFADKEEQIVFLVFAFIERILNRNNTGIR